MKSNYKILKPNFIANWNNNFKLIIYLSIPSSNFNGFEIIHLKPNRWNQFSSILDILIT